MKISTDVDSQEASKENRGRNQRNRKFDKGDQKKTRQPKGAKKDEPDNDDTKPYAKETPLEEISKQRRRRLPKETKEHQKKQNDESNESQPQAASSETFATNGRNTASDRIEDTNDTIVRDLYQDRYFQSNDNNEPNFFTPSVIVLYIFYVLYNYTIYFDI